MQASIPVMKARTQNKTELAGLQLHTYHKEDVPTSEISKYPKFHRVHDSVEAVTKGSSNAAKVTNGGGGLTRNFSQEYLAPVRLNTGDSSHFDCAATTKANRKKKKRQTTEIA
jgi:hypothetical protein